MGGRDKLSLPLAGRPLLAWTLDAIRAARTVRRLVVVAAPERVAPLAASAWIRAADAEVVAGGERRQESVAAGVQACDAPVVLVHDGARPLVPPALVDEVARSAAEHGAALPVLPILETVKRLEGGRVGGTVPREGLATAQTPQGARRALLLAAYAVHDPAGGRTFTDEAALFEAAGIPVTTVAGDSANLKVTLPEDLARAEALLLARTGPPRIGYGVDSHPFGPGAGLALGGITLDLAPRLEGHSDGDAALHAVADALLGATGRGDLGRLFPAGEAATRGISSAELLRAVVAEVRTAGFRPVGVDLTIVAARPRLGGARLEAMRDVLADLLGLEGGDVSVKASTGNWSGPEGAGRAISATAVASVLGP